MECIFWHLQPYLMKKRVLKYPISIHIQRVTDFSRRSPPTSYGSSPPSSDGDTGYDGNPDKEYMEYRSSGPRCSSFPRCTIQDAAVAAPSHWPLEKSKRASDTTKQKRKDKQCFSQKWIPKVQKEAEAREPAGPCPKEASDKDGQAKEAVPAIGDRPRGDQHMVEMITYEDQLPQRSNHECSGQDPMCDESQDRSSEHILGRAAAVIPELTLSIQQPPLPTDTEAQIGSVLSSLPNPMKGTTSPGVQLLSCRTS